MKTGLIFGAIGLIAAASIGVSADPQVSAAPRFTCRPVQPLAKRASASLAVAAGEAKDRPHRPT